MGDVDVALRGVSQRFPSALAQVLCPPGTVVQRAWWMDTQLALRERRLDRALRVRTATEERVHHVEWVWRWREDLPRRVFDYHAMVVAALHAEHEEALAA